MTRTKIDWCDFTWNPVVGCTGGCPYCYARKMAHRFHRDFRPHWVQKNFERAMPRKAGRIFVNSMSDLADWKDEWLDRVSCVIATHPEHLFLFLSKRPWAAPWTSLPNAMLGYSVTRQDDCARLMHNGLHDVSFLSIEPILEPIVLCDATIREDMADRLLCVSWAPLWIIVGAETGNRKGKMRPHLEWLREIQSFACEHGIPLFFKESLREIWPTIDDDAFPQEYPS